MSGRPIQAIATVLAATVLVVLDASIVNLALPTLARDLRATPADSILVVTAYQLALVMALLPCAALGESLGFRRVFRGGVALFTAASLLCAVAPSLPWLVVARFLQGLGGAGVMALSVALLRQVVPPESLGAAIGWNALAVAVASALGPSLGALILSSLGWPWLFVANLPVGVAVMLAGRALPRIRGAGRPLDWFSVVLNATVFGALVVGADLLAHEPAASIVFAAAAGVTLLILVRREIPKAAPLVPLDLLRVRAFSISVVASVCCFIGQAAALLALPFHLQHGLGQSLPVAGLYMTAWPVTVALVAQAAGWLSDRVSTAWLCGFGGICMALGLAGLALSHSGLRPVALVAFIALCGLGFGLFQTPNNRSMLLTAPPERSGAAGGMQGMARLTGQTAGAVLMTLLFTMTSISAAPRLGLYAAAAFAFAAGLISTARLGVRASAGGARRPPRYGQGQKRPRSLASEGLDCD